MAVGTRLVLKFETGYGQKTWSFNHAKSNATVANVRALMDTMITNGSIYKYPPLRKVSAELQTTTSASIDVGD